MFCFNFKDFLRLGFCDLKLKKLTETAFRLFCSATSMAFTQEAEWISGFSLSLVFVCEKQGQDPGWRLVPREHASSVVNEHYKQLKRGAASPEALGFVLLRSDKLMLCAAQGSKVNPQLSGL